MKRITGIAAGLLVVAFSLFGCAGAPSGPGWVTLIDGENGLQNFTQLGAANWTASGGAIWADRKATADAGILLSKNSYTDFELYVEFWAADENTNSGVYIRVMNQKVVNSRAAYEVQIWDNPTAPAFPTASLIPAAKAEATFKGGGRWNTFDVTAKGPRITVRMNGEQSVDANDAAYTSGPIALQYNAGTIKFRKVMVKPL
jgi:hypothetical protein